MHVIPWTIGCVLAATLVPSMAAAQSWDEPWSDPRDYPPRVDLAVNAGMVAPTDWSDLVVLGTLSPLTGVFEQVLVRDVSVEPDVEYSAAVTYWRDRYGLRVQGALSRSTLTLGGPLDGGPRLTASGVNTWFYDVRGAIGLVEYSPTRNVWPYAFIGLGGITYDLERRISPPLLTFIQEGVGRPGSPGQIIVVDDDAGREFLLAIDELERESVLALNFGVGTDFRLPFSGGGLGVRVEVSDHVASSPLIVRIRELGPAGGLTSEDTVEFNTVHHLRATVGVVVQIGR